MAKLKTDLIQEVLQQLGALGVGETVSTDDSNAVDATLAGVIADLAARRITGTINTASISETIFPDLVAVLVEHVAPKYGRPTNQDAITAAEERLARVTRFDRTAATPLVRQVLEQLELFGATKAALDATAISDRITNVLAELTARRVFTITTEASVPANMLPPLARYIAASLAEPQMAEVMAEAESRLAQIARLDRTTSTVLVRRVLELFDTIGVDTTALDAQAVSDRIPAILAELAMRNVIYFADEASVPDYAVPALTRYVAGTLSPAKLLPLAADAEAQLRTMARIGKGTGRKLRVDGAIRPHRWGH